MDKLKLETLLRQSLELPWSEKTLQITAPLHPWIKEYTYDAKAKAELMAFLKAVPEVSSVFSGKMVKFGSSATLLEIEHLADWLFGSAIQAGHDVAVERLARYLSNDRVPGYDILAIRGIQVPKRIELSNDIAIIPFNALSNSMPKSMLTPAPRSFFSEQEPTAALIAKNESYPKVDSEPGEQITHPYIPRSLELEELCLWLTLIGPCSPLSVAFWWEPEDWVPCARPKGGGFGGRVYDVVHGPIRQFNEEDVRKATEIYKIVRELNNDLKTHFQIPISRLNRAIRRHHPTDAAIELGIALESLFLTDIDSREGEISFKLRLRGAWYLGETKKERERLLKSFRDLYACRSIAVHTGMLDRNIKGISTPTEELIKEGCQLVARTIEKLAANRGIPDWNSMILGD